MRIVMFQFMAISVSLSQDYTNYYQINGFQNPALRSGQYLISVTPNYYYSTPEYTSQRTANGSSEVSNSQNTSSDKISSIDLSLNSYYGLTNDITMNVALSLFPKQNDINSNSTTVSTYTYGLSSGSNNNISNVAYSTSNINSSLILSYRPQYDIEISFRAVYYTFSSTMGLTGSQQNAYSSNPTVTSNITGSSLSKRKVYNVGFTFVFIGN